MFARKSTYHFSIPKEYLEAWLAGGQLKIRGLDFEIVQDGPMMLLTPIPEQEQAARTIPVTHIEMTGDGNKTSVTITCEMNPVDGGIPMLLMVSSTFMLAIAAVFYWILPGTDRRLSFIFVGLAAVLLIYNLIRMQVVYFRHVRRVRDQLKSIADGITTDVRHKLFKHKAK